LMPGQRLNVLSRATMPFRSAATKERVTGTVTGNGTGTGTGNGSGRSEGLSGAEAVLG
jgi:hypothetical protein